MGAEIPAGWYPNPYDDAEELYWSGSEWTGVSRAVRRAPGRIPLDLGAVPGRPEPEIDDVTIVRSSTGPTEPAADPAPPSLWDAALPQAAPRFAYAAPAPESSAGPGPAPAPGPASAPEPATAAAAYPSAAAPYPSSPAPYPPTAAQYPPSPASNPPAAGPNGTPGTPDAASLRQAFGGPWPTPRRAPQGRFGLVSLIAAIVAAVAACIPGVSLVAWVPAFAAIAFGIVGFLGVRPRGLALAGIIVGGLALAVGTGVSIGFLVGAGR